jgi:hypothetical protein
MTVTNPTTKLPTNVRRILALAPHTALTRSIRSTVVWVNDVGQWHTIGHTFREGDSNNENDCDYSQDHPACVFDGKIHTCSSAVHRYARLLHYVNRTSFGSNEIGWDAK